MSDGFLRFEPTDNLRGTNGDATLPSDIFHRFDDEELEIVLTPAGATRYPDYGHSGGRNRRLRPRHYWNL